MNEQDAWEGNFMSCQMPTCGTLHDVDQICQGSGWKFPAREKWWICRQKDFHLGLDVVYGCQPPVHAPISLPGLEIIPNYTSPAPVIGHWCRCSKTMRTDALYLRLYHAASPHIEYFPSRHWKMLRVAHAVFRAAMFTLFSKLAVTFFPACQTWSTMLLAPHVRIVAIHIQFPTSVYEFHTSASVCVCISRAELCHA